MNLFTRHHVSVARTGNNSGKTVSVGRSTRCDETFPCLQTKPCFHTTAKDFSDKKHRPYLP